MNPAIGSQKRYFGFLIKTQIDAKTIWPSELQATLGESIKRADQVAATVVRQINARIDTFIKGYIQRGS